MFGSPPRLPSDVDGVGLVWRTGVAAVLAPVWPLLLVEAGGAVVVCEEALAFLPVLAGGAVVVCEEALAFLPVLAGGSVVGNPLLPGGLPLPVRGC